jgi:hypothetical protein
MKGEFKNGNLHVLAVWVPVLLLLNDFGLCAESVVVEASSVHLLSHHGLVLLHHLLAHHLMGHLSLHVSSLSVHILNRLF